jgi:hypothetical protein
VRFLALAVLLAIANVSAWCDDRLHCESVDGTYLSGTVIKGPVFKHGQYKHGIELSHTHVSLLADQDGKTYDVAIDNVFANGYDPRRAGIPAPLDAIKVKDRLELCGQLYSRGVGLHFVHTNCGASPTPQHPDGWIKELANDGRPGVNLDANTSFCRLFPGQRSRQHSRSVHR